MTSSGFMTLRFPNTEHPFQVGNAAKPMKPAKTSLSAAASDSDTAAAVTPPPTTTSVKKPKVWRCDICKKRHFEDFDEACAHEVECEKQMKAREKRKKEEQEKLLKEKQLQKQAQKKEELEKPQEIIQQETQTKVTEPQVQQRLQKEAPVIDPSGQREKQPAQRVKMKHPEQQKDEKDMKRKQKKPPTVSKSTRKSVQKVKKSETNGEEKKEIMKSKAKSAPAAPMTHSFFAPRKPGAASSKKRPSPKASGTVNAFFQPRTSKKQKASSSTVTPSSSMSQQSTVLSQSSVMDVMEESTPPSAQNSMASTGEVQMIESKQSKPKKQRKRCHKQEEVSVENAHLVANALAAMVNRQTSPPSSQSSSSSSSKNLPLAGIFKMPSKELLAEQRQAEFQAKRRLERQKELERQQKRQERAMTEPPRKPKQSSVPKLPLAPRFPVPSHVTKTPDVLDPVPICVADGWRRSMDTDPSSSHERVYKKLVSSPCALDCLSDPSEKEPSIQMALHQVLVPKSSAQPKLLVDQYSNHLVGDTLQEIQSDMVKWVREWCKVRQEAWKRMMERQRKLAKRPKARIKKKKQYDYEEDDLWDDELELGNLVLLTGACASGKTSLVQKVAMECQCPVLEINTTQARGGAALKHAIQEATQSCSSLEMIQRQSRKLNQSPFCEDSEDDEKDSQKLSALTVILIDEVDFLFEEQGDAGFWNALAAVTKTAKCPIFVTANQMPPPMQQLQRFHHWNLPMPSPDECMTKLLQVCRQEGIPMRPELNRDDIKRRLLHVAEICRCDIRRMLNELQSFLYPLPDLARNKRTENGPSNNLEWSASVELPRMESLTPNKVTRKKHSIVTCHGKNFHSLLRFQGEWKVLLGDQRCESHVVDDENLLILCPPQLQKDFQSISIQLSNGGKIGCTSVETLDLPGGSSITGRRCVWLQYGDAEEVSKEVKDDEEEEVEFEGGKEKKPKEDLKISVTTKDVEEDKGVLDSWKSITAEQDGTKSVPEESNSKSQDDHLVALEMLAENACDLSDAALLEDLQHGVPSLSGACLGYGFDLTDGAEAEKGKMKMSEQLRPPGEERLYELGWKDSCYFFGNAETYMVHPTTAMERLLIRSEMKYSRGFGYHVAPQTPCESKEEGEDEIDMEEFAAEHMHSTCEDKYLPLNTSTLVLSLPSLIRQKAGRKSSYYHFFDESVFHMQRKQQLTFAQDLTSKMRLLQRQPQTHVISPFVAENKTSATYVLELLPMLRRVSVLERDSEQISSVAAEDRNVRSTRTRSRRGRRHYFEKLGFIENHDQDMTASKAGQNFADSFLVYDKTEKKLE